MLHRLYKIQNDEDSSIVFIPTLQKLFLVSSSENLPDEIEAPEDDSVPKNLGQFPEYRFRATQLILNNTCNLRCIYCYADSGEQPRQVMSFQFAKSAIDRVVADTKALGFPVFELSLIGGEPTLEMGLVKKCVDYAREAAQKNGIISRVGIVSNGVFRRSVCDYIAEHLDYVTISIDGPEKIHEVHRPSENKKPTFGTTVRNISSLYDSGIALGLRATISSLSVQQMPEIVSYLHELCPKSTIGLELVQECGRSASTEGLAPDLLIYADKMVETLVLARDVGMRLKSSILRFSSSDDHLSFCGVNGKNFAITPEGDVTACTRVTSNTHPLAHCFVFGHYDYSQKDFVLDDTRYKWLRTLDVENIKGCEGCFARFNCKGDCPAVKSDYSQNFATETSARCEAIRRITLGLFRSQLGLI